MQIFVKNVVYYLQLMKEYSCENYPVIFNVHFIILQAMSMAQIKQAMGMLRKSCVGKTEVSIGKVNM